MLATGAGDTEVGHFQALIGHDSRLCGFHVTVDQPGAMGDIPPGTGPAQSTGWHHRG